MAEGITWADSGLTWIQLDLWVAYHNFTNILKAVVSSDEDFGEILITMYVISFEHPLKEYIVLESSPDACSFQRIHPAGSLSAQQGKVSSIALARLPKATMGGWQSPHYLLFSAKIPNTYSIQGSIKSIVKHFLTT